MQHLGRLSRAVQTYIDTHQLILSHQRILVAISGGPDSVFLAYCLQLLGYEIGLAHVNYQLRGEDSQKEEALVRQLGQKWGVPVFVHVAKLKIGEASGSLQMLAREERYHFFEKLIHDHPYDICATAHHADDQIETYLMSLIKGNGFDLLSGIPQKRDKYVRPLLGLYKSEIVAALEADQIAYSIDYTNHQDTYQRNIIRNKVVPVLESVNPNLHKQILERADWSQKQTTMLRKILEGWYEKSVTEYKYYFALDEREYVQAGWKNELTLFYAYVLEKWGMHGHRMWEGIRLSERIAGKYVEIDDHSILYKTSTGLLLTRVGLKRESACLLKEVQLKGDSCRISWGIYDIHVRKYNSVNGWNKNPFVLFMDLDKIVFPLTFRSWQQGDRMQPLGMYQLKKVSDIFIDEKYNPFEKQSAVIVESDGEIVGISGYRIAETVKIDETTHEILEIRFEPQI